MSSALRDYASTDVCPKCEYAVEKFVKVEALDHVWHKWCLKCSICEEPLSPNDNCHMRELPNLLCKTHFDDPTAVVEAAENESGGSDVTDMITYSAGTKLVSNSERFEVGTAETAGTRPYMEDAMVVAGCFDGDPEKDFFAVYDGHGGSEAAGYACSHLHHFLKTYLKEHEPEESLKKSFVTVSENITNGNIRCGTTALAAYADNKNIYFANAGDCRAILWCSGKLERITTDHKADNSSERRRIKELGGHVKKSFFGPSRVNGVLCVSRSLGDGELKPYVTDEPDVFQRKLERSSDWLLVMATDGLWDVVSDSRAIKTAKSQKSAKQASEILRDLAVKRNSADNISVMVLKWKSL